jgi:hypothetical protein
MGVILSVAVVRLRRYLLSICRSSALRATAK